jgi:tight adherence protein B
MPVSTLVPAALIFLAVALGTIAVAALAEWGQERMRARTMVQRLREFSETALDSGEQTLVREPLATMWQDRVLGILPTRRIGLLLERGGGFWTIQTFLLMCAGLAVAFGVLGIMLSKSLLGGVLLAPFGALVPYLVAYARGVRRIGRLESQLPDAIDLMARAMRAGHPLNAGFKMVAEEGPKPIASEFGQVFEEQRFGLPFDDSLIALATRIPLADMRILVTAIMVHRQVGGNLAEILDNIAYIVRERFRLRRQLNVVSAQGRLSGYILVALPIALGIAVYSINPDYIMPLFNQPLGQRFLLGGILFQLIGFLWIRRILDIEF